MNFKEILTSAKTIAILGCSAEPNRTSYGIARQLQRNGYQIIPINPNYDEVLGETCYKQMADIPPDIHVDIAVIFRNSAFSEQMVRSVVEWSKKTGKKPVVWTQLDVSSPEAEELAAANDLPYVENRCIGLEYAKHVG